MRAVAEIALKARLAAGPRLIAKVQPTPIGTQAETSVLFELIARRYETRSLAITANQPFSAWDRVFPDKAMTVAAIDRLVHYATTSK